MGPSAIAAMAELEVKPAELRLLLFAGIDTNV
jgi:hypothetical protein